MTTRCESESERIYFLFHIDKSSHSWRNTCISVGQLLAVKHFTAWMAWQWHYLTPSNVRGCSHTGLYFSLSYLFSLFCLRNQFSDCWIVSLIASYVTGLRFRVVLMSLVRSMPMDLCDNMTSAVKCNSCNFWSFIKGFDVNIEFLKDSSGISSNSLHKVTLKVLPNTHKHMNAFSSIWIVIFMTHTIWKDIRLSEPWIFISIFFSHVFCQTSMLHFLFLSLMVKDARTAPLET